MSGAGVDQITPNPNEHLKFNWQPHNQQVAYYTMYNLPDELLAHIFLITTHNADLVDLHIDPFIKSYYQQLFILTSVCSRWRSICLSQGSFWSKIPLSHNVKGKAFGFITDLCLERARDSDLHVVGVLGSYMTLGQGLVIAKHGPQIRSCIIEGNHPSELRRVLLMLLDFSRPGNIATLYIRDYDASLHPHSSGPWYLFPPTSAEHAQLTTFVEHLTELCLSGFELDWGQLRFSRLVSLTLQGVIIEDISTMINLLIALPSAPRLQHLKLLDLVPNAFLDYTQQFNQHPHLPVRLASLQSLLMKDLDADFIFVLLQAIAPGSYPITLSFSSQSHLFTLLEGPASRKAANDDLKDMPAPNAFTLRDFNIDTLVLEGWWVHRADLHCLLGEMPFIQTLGFHQVDLSQCDLESIICRNEEDFPRIRRLRFFHCTFEQPSLEILKAIVISHDLGELEIGGPSRDAHSNDGLVRFEDSKDAQRIGSITEWFKSNVPNFRLVTRAVPYLNFQSYVW